MATDLLRDMLRLARSIPVRVAVRLDRWVLGMHRPVEAVPGEAWCVRCERHWPCDEAVKVLDRYDAKDDIRTDED